GASREEGLLVAVRADEQVAQVVGSVAGRVAGPEPPPADLDLAALPERYVLELEPGCLRGADLRARLALQLPSARHEVVVDVGLQGVGDVDVELLGLVEVPLDVSQRIHGDGLSAVGIRDKEGRVPELGRPEEIDPGPGPGGAALAGGCRRCGLAHCYGNNGSQVGVAEPVDALDLGSSGATRGGSSPLADTSRPERRPPRPPGSSGRDGGNGRRGGLKNRSPQGGGGSTPPPGTNVVCQEIVDTCLATWPDTARGLEARSRQRRPVQGARWPGPNRPAAGP